MWISSVLLPHDFRYLDQTSSNCPNTKNSDSFTVWVSLHLMWNLEVNTLGRFVSLHMIWGPIWDQFFKLTLRWLFYLSKVSFDVKRGVDHFKSCVHLPMIWVLFGPNFPNCSNAQNTLKMKINILWANQWGNIRGRIPHLINKSSIPSFPY